MLHFFWDTLYSDLKIQLICTANIVAAKQTTQNFYLDADILNSLVFFQVKDFKFDYALD